jgi:Bacterial Ig-like domain
VRLGAWCALCCLLALSAAAQMPGRIATTPAALRAAPVFFHGKQIAVVGNIVDTREFARLEPASVTEGSSALPDVSSRPIFVFWREQARRSSGEIRGEFWDLGRLTEGDSRFSSYNFRGLVDAVADGRWPTRDQMFVVVGATMMESTLPASPTLRAIVLAPEKYENRSAKVSGRFRGRNLYGDMAAPLPSPSKWDFVIQSADAAVWVSGARPKGKGFELDPGARVDTGRWLQVSGMVRREGSRVWVQAEEIELSSAPDETPVEIDVPTTPREPPPSVTFSAPVPDEADVDTATSIRIQFSRDMDGRTLKDRIRITYLPAQGVAPPPPLFTANYNAGNHGVEIKLAKRLEAFQTVKVELLEGITALDGQQLAPWSLTFSTAR